MLEGCSQEDSFLKTRRLFIGLGKQQNLMSPLLITIFYFADNFVHSNINIRS